MDILMSIYKGRKDGSSHNHLIISQLCDKGYRIKFEKDRCHIEENESNIIFKGNRKRNIYILNMKY